MNDIKVLEYLAIHATRGNSLNEISNAIQIDELEIENILKKYPEIVKEVVKDQYQIYGNFNNKIDHLKGLNKPKESDDYMNWQPMSISDLMSYEVGPVNWVVEGYIPEKAVVFFCGKRASYKTWSVLQMALSIASGSDFLGRFGTKKATVLYIDEENGKETLKERIEMLRAGMKLDKIDNIFFVSYESVKIEDGEWRDRLDKFLEEHGPCVVVIDSFRRVIRCDENDAREVSSIFTEIIRPMAEKYNATFILVHHLRKGMVGKHPDDLMDELRGSSEIANYAGVIITQDKIRNVDGKLIIRQLKCRGKKELPPYKINTSFSKYEARFSIEGEAEELVDASESCANAIKTWIKENELYGELRTSQIVEEMGKSGHTKPTIERALRLLKERGELVLVKRGVYRLKRESLKEYETSSHPNHPDGNETEMEDREGIISSINLYNREGSDGKNPENETVLKLIDALQNKDGLTPISEIISKVEAPEDKVKSIIAELIDNGRVFEPRSGFLKCL